MWIRNNRCCRLQALCINAADILQHFIASREKHESNNTSIQHRSAPPIKVATLPFIAAEKRSSPTHQACTSTSIQRGINLS